MYLRFISEFNPSTKRVYAGIITLTPLKILPHVLGDRNGQSGALGSALELWYCCWHPWNVRPLSNAYIFEYAEGLLLRPMPKGRSLDGIA